MAESSADLRQQQLDKADQLLQKIQSLGMRQRDGEDDSL